MTQSKFEGVWTAIITPFTRDGSIDEISYRKLVQQQLEAGVHGLVVCGTTGEAPTLSDDEKLLLIKITREEAGPSYPVMAGTGSNNTAASIALSHQALEAGADSLLIVTPPYNKPSFSGLKLHYQAIAASTGAPLCLYHVPARTAQKLTPEQISELTKIDQIRCVKEATGEEAFFAATVKLCNVGILSGDDALFHTSLKVGGAGLISVTSNLFPKELVQLYESFRNNHLNRAEAIAKCLAPAMDILFCESNPGPIKYALSKLGIGENALRLPLAQVSSESAARITEVITSTKKNLDHV